MPSVVIPIEFNLSPVPVNLCISRRDSFPFGFTLSQSGSPINLTSSTFLFTVDTAADGSGTQLFQISNSNALTTDGVITFTPSVVDLTQNPQTSFYDIQWTDPSANVRTVIKGSFRFDPDIT